MQPRIHDFGDIHSPRLHYFKVRAMLDGMTLVLDDLELDAARRNIREDVMELLGDPGSSG